jgi:alkanesulfonate monooxygenase SsuD/methylene tetrahydromethanopterin reductase-like flavin-dependent oxidoreductase (luciferase family)
MQIGLALPTTVHGVDGPLLLDWARRAEDAGFSTLGVLDRLAYDNLEPLLSLAAAAAVTRRIRLATTVLTPAYRTSVAVLAKQIATLDRLAAGRLTVGVAAGGREDDFDASGASFRTRGKRLDAMLTDIRQIWSAKTEPVGPQHFPKPLTIVVGGHSQAAIRRAALHGDGWIGGGGSPTVYADLVRQVHAAWAEAGRDGSPYLMSNAYISVGPHGRDIADRYLHDYYGFAPQKAELLAESVITTDEQLRATLSAYAEAGCDELILLPCSADTVLLDAIIEELRRAR